MSLASAPTGPSQTSPSKPSNPFARPRAEPTTVKRAALLPSRLAATAENVPVDGSAVASTSADAGSAAGATASPPVRRVALAAGASATPTTSTFAGHGTPGVYATPGTTPGGSGTPRRAPYRLLWRGGLEVGPDGWRLDGVTFTAKLVPGATPARPFPSPVSAAAAFEAAAAGTPDTDLCLSLESMRGRKYLQIRGVMELGDEDIEVDDGNVQMSITAPLLAAFFTGLLCRTAKLSPQGKTTTGVIIGLGDEGVDTDSSTMVVYGQRQGDAAHPTLRLCVGRKRAAPPPAEKKVRPGEPLPRSSLFEKVSKRPSLGGPLGFGRTTSVSSIYAPPPQLTSRPSMDRERSSLNLLPKRRRDSEYDNERRRKAGRLAAGPGAGAGVGPSSIASSNRLEVPAARSRTTPDEDIFGSRAASVAPSLASHGDGKKRAPDSQQAVANKAMVRKQTMLILESRGCARDHPEFKDVFGYTYKGVYLALRYKLEDRLDKNVVQDLVVRHLDMYLPSAPEGTDIEDEAEDEDEDDAPFGEAAGNPSPDADMSLRSFRSATDIDMRTPSPRR